MTGLNQEVQFPPDKPWQLLWVLARTKSLSSTSFRVPSQSCQRPRWPGLLGTRGLSGRHEGRRRRPDLAFLRVQALLCWMWILAASRGMGKQQPPGPPVPMVPSALQARDTAKGGQGCAPWKGFTSTSGTGSAVDNRIFFFF